MNERLFESMVALFFGGIAIVAGTITVGIAASIYYSAPRVALFFVGLLAMFITAIVNQEGDSLTSMLFVALTSIAVIAGIGYAVAFLTAGYVVSVFMNITALQVAASAVVVSVGYVSYAPVCKLFSPPSSEYFLVIPAKRGNQPRLEDIALAPGDSAGIAPQ